MKRIILFVSLLLLTYVNSNAENTAGSEPSALTADFTASVTSGCAPLVVQFNGSASTFNPGDPIVSYTWDFGDGTVINTTNPSPTHTFTTTDPFKSFTVKLTVTSQSGGTNAITKPSYITIYEKPVFNLGNDTTVCVGTELFLKSVSGYDSYFWSVGSSTTPNLYVTPDEGINTIWAEVTNGTCKVRDTIIITASKPLTAKFGYQILSNCGNVQVQFIDSSLHCNSEHPITFKGWYFSDGGEYYDEDPIHTFSTGGTYDLFFEIGDDYGGYDYIDTQIVIPNPTPGPTPVNLGGPINICEGSSVELDAGYEPGATYVWTPATGLSSTSIYNPVASPATTTTYTVTKSKCGLFAPDASVIINVNPAFTVNLGPDQSMCSGANITLDAGVTGATYKWGSTYSPAYASMVTKTVVALGAGTYWVAVTKGGCTVSDTIVITAKPAVTAFFTHAQTGSCTPIPVSFTDASTPCSGSTTNHIWNFGDGTPAVSGFYPTVAHNFATPGTYIISLTVTTSGGASDTYNESIVVTGNTAPVVNLGPDASICPGGNITLDAGDHGTGATYSWSTGATTRTINVTTAGNYSVTVTKDGCSGTGTKNITENTTPLVVDLGPDKTMCPGANLILDAGVTGATYKWGSTFSPAYATMTTKPVTIA
ncbi:MAG: PKD domain-containing protein [Chitinophagaceae bacterium]|nr:PKD domain-containing protein [Chitinophagaceae bacterium]